MSESTTGGSQASAAWAGQLRGPISLLLTNGQVIRGEFLSATDNAITIRQRTQEGEIDFAFQRGRIARITLPGDEVLRDALAFAEEGLHEEALVRLDALFRQRIRFFPLLPQKDLVQFIQAPLSALEVGQPSRSIALARELQPYLSDDPSAVATLRDCELLGLYQLRILSEAYPMALEWIENEEPYSTSALGYMVLSGIEYLRGDYEKALWISLIPCIYSSGSRVDYLEGCYSIAVASFHALEDMKQRDALINEMETRGVRWLNLRLFDFAGVRIEDVPKPATGVLSEPQVNPLEPLSDLSSEIRKLESIGVRTARESEGESLMPGYWMPTPRLVIR
ncbi:MAG: hypothetical protein ACFCU4_00215 [Puniceicoccaceae bacterium]